MANISENTAQEVLDKRDTKAKPHLKQYAPVWIVDEIIMLEDEAVQFNAVFLHPRAGLNERPGWVSRRYRYDGFNDTLYHKGQTVLDEEDVLELQEAAPYIDASITDTPNAYGG